MTEDVAEALNHEEIGRGSSVGVGLADVLEGRGTEADETLAVVASEQLVFQRWEAPVKCLVRLVSIYWVVCVCV